MNSFDFASCTAPRKWMPAEESKSSNSAFRPQGETQMTYTAEEVIANLNAARERAKPAILADVPDNGHLVTAYIKRNNLEPSADNFYKAIVALMASLRWVVKPAALTLRESANKPAAAENQLDIEEKRRAAIKAADEKAKIEREFAALVLQCQDLISSYYPRKKSGAIDYPEQAESQKKWRATLEDAKKKNNLGWMRSYRDSLVKTVRNRYETQEKASERL